MLYLEKRIIKSKSGKTSTRYYIRGTCPYTGEPVREGTKTSDRSAAADVLAIRLEQRRKRGMRGTYQHCKEKHLHRYLAEFDFRHNNRVRLGVSDEERAAKMVKGAQGRRLTYRTTDRA